MAIEGTVIKIKTPSMLTGVSVATIGLGSIIQKTAKVTTTNVNDLVTALIGRYRINGYLPERVARYTNNVSTFGLKEEEHNFFIYDSEGPVKNVLKLWGYYLSNIWKTISFDSDLSSVDLTIGDIATLTFGYAVPDMAKCLIIETTDRSESDIIGVTLLTSVKTGTLTADDNMFELGEYATTNIEADSESDFAVIQDDTCRKLLNEGAKKREKVYLTWVKSGTHARIFPDRARKGEAFTLRLEARTKPGYKAFAVPADNTDPDPAGELAANYSGVAYLHIESDKNDVCTVEGSPAFGGPDHDKRNGDFEIAISSGVWEGDILIKGPPRFSRVTFDVWTQDVHNVRGPQHP